MSLRKKIDKQFKNMPKYSIVDEVFDTQALARIRAFGQDRDIQMAQEDIDQSSADAVSQAQDVSSSTADLLGTISAIESNKTGAIRRLTQDASGIRRQNIGDLYQINQSIVDEKDKAWYQNVYAPWEAKLRNLQQRKANRAAFWGAVIPGALSAVGSVVGGIFGGPMGSSIGGKAGAADGQALSAGINASNNATNIGYNPLMPYS